MAVSAAFSPAQLPVSCWLLACCFRNREVDGQDRVPLLLPTTLHLISSVGSASLHALNNHPQSHPGTLAGCPEVRGHWVRVTLLHHGAARQGLLFFKMLTVGAASPGAASHWDTASVGSTAKDSSIVWQEIQETALLVWSHP